MRFRINMRFIAGLLVLGLLSATIFNFSYALDELDKKKNVLLLCSYSENFSMTTDELKGLANILDENDIRLTIEYMNSKEFPTQDNIDSFEKRISFVMNNHDTPYDLIMAANDDALDFVVDHDNLFGDKPVVFFGINDKKKALKLGENDRFFGLIEDLSIENTIRIAQKLQPDATRVVALADNSKAGSLARDEFYKKSSKFPNLNFSDYNFSITPFDEIMNKINDQGEETIFIYLIVTKNNVNHNYQLKEIGPVMTEKSNYPIYVLFDFALSYGFVGGEVLSFNQQGAQAAQIAVDLLKNNKRITPSVKGNSLNSVIFDYEIMKQYNLDEDLLPYNTTIIYKEVSFFEEYFFYIVGVLSAFAVLIILIILLLRAIAINKRAQKQLIEKNRQINKLVLVDSLTGHNNRLAIMNIIDACLLEKNSMYMVIFIDIDNFKYINDSFGHEFGDGVIREVSNRIHTLNRFVTQFGRCGGDELLAIKQIGSAEDVELAISDILNLFKNPFNIDDTSIYVTVSLGASLYPEHGLVRKELIKKADIALYQTKEAGRNNGALYDGGMIEDIKEKLVFQAKLREAFLNREFYLAYQPLYYINPSTYKGVETLIRWESDTLGYVSPQRLIEEAEKIGLIYDLGSWIIESAFEFCNRLNREIGSDIFVTINISSTQLKYDKFISDLKSLIQTTQVDTKKIYFEITESVLLEFTQANIDVINQIKALGIKIAIDDFGTGYSSLDYFKKLPADLLKIDKIFIDQMEQNQIDYQIVEFIIDLAHNKGLTVTAEGVETTSQLEVLKRIHCDAIQGYYFSKALKEEAIINFLKA